MPCNDQKTKRRRPRQNGNEGTRQDGNECSQITNSSPFTVVIQVLGISTHTWMMKNRGQRSDSCRFVLYQNSRMCHTCEKEGAIWQNHLDDEEQGPAERQLPVCVVPKYQDVPHLPHAKIPPKYQNIRMYISAEVSVPNIGMYINTNIPKYQDVTHLPHMHSWMKWSTH